MDNKEVIDRIIEKLDIIRADQIDQGKTLAVQEANLREHMRRTELNEVAVVETRRQNERSIEVLKTELKPIQAHVETVNAGLKIFSGLAFLAGFILTVIEITKHL